MKKLQKIILILSLLFIVILFAYIFWPRPICEIDSNCDDSNDYTKDSCVFPKTLKSHCIHENIKCMNILDCDDSNNYTKDSCIFPKTLKSHCIHENIKCMNISDCDDLNEYTNDNCVFPKTPKSYCSHQEIKCLDNSDCGTNGYDEKYCDGNTVQKDFITHTCQNPATPNSYCIQDKSTEILKECSFPYDCEKGMCLEMNCIDVPGAVNTGFPVISRIFFENPDKNNQLSILVTKTNAKFRVHIFNDQNGFPGDIRFSSDVLDDDSIDKYGWLKISLPRVTMPSKYYWIIIEIVEQGDLVFNTCTYNDHDEGTYSLTNYYKDGNFEFDLSKDYIDDQYDIVYLFE